MNEGYYLEVELDSSKEKNYFYSSFSNIKKGDYVVVETGSLQTFATSTPNSVSTTT